MKTITRTYNLYPINELSETAIKTAYRNWLNDFHYFCEDDNHNTLNTFCELFDIICNDWQYDSCNYSFRFSMKSEEEIQNMKGQRLATYLYNNFYHSLFTSKIYYSKDSKKNRKSNILKNTCCVLTGYYLDEEILSPIRQFLDKPDINMNFYNLIDKCLTTYFKACVSDVYYCQSMENFKEDSIINEWEYLDNGKIFN